MSSATASNFLIRHGRRARHLLRVLVRKELWLRPEVMCEVRRFGSDYAGFSVSNPSQLHDGAIVYSFGIGEDISFDLELIQSFGVTVHAFDPTPRSLQWIRKRPPIANLIVHDFGIGAVDGNVRFEPPKNPNHVSFRVASGTTCDDAVDLPVLRLRTIMSKLGHSQIDVLKLDIEGSEYEVIADLVQSGIRPRQILVEFHHRFPGRTISDTRTAVRLLNETGYRLFSVSESFQEYGFLFTADQRDSVDDGHLTY